MISVSAKKPAPAAATFRFSGHLIDAVLRRDHTDPEPSSESITEHRTLSHLTASALKMLDVLALLLSRKSQFSTPSAECYYTGDVRPHRYIPYGARGYRSICPGITTTYYEVAAEYSPGRVSGKATYNVKKVLLELSSENRHIYYVEKTKNENNPVEFLTPLIELKDLSGTCGKIQIKLNPIFRSQIDKKWISFPLNIVQRTVKAYGHQRINRVTLILRNFLLRVISGRRTKFEISKEKLFQILAPDDWKESRKKKITTEYKRALETMKKMGILTDYSEEEGKNGSKAVFSLNREWI